MAFAPRQLPPGEFSWVVPFGKALRDVAGVALVGAIVVALGVFSDFFTAEKLAELQVPSYYALAIVAVFRVLQNILRVRFGLPVAIALLSFLGLTAAPAAVPAAHAEDYTVAVALQGLLDPHIVGGASYNTETKTWAAVLTANVVGVKLGSLPCYASGLGVSLNTLAPGLEDAPIAAASLPLLTCAPFGEQVVIQTGISIPLNGGPTASKSYYAGLGISVSGGPNQLKAKRIARIKAKEKRALLELQDEANRTTAVPAS